MSKLAKLVRKDVLCLLRARHIVVSTLGFALLLVVVAGFSFRQVGFGQRELADITPGVLWMVFLFCSVLGLNYSFAAEEEQGGLAGLVLTGVDPGQIYLGKFLTNFVFLGITYILVLIAHGLLFGVEYFDRFGSLVIVAVLFGAGFSALGTLLAGIAACSRAREVVLPLTLFPLTIPLVAASVLLCRGVLDTGGIDVTSFWFLLLCGFDVIAVVLSWALFEHVVKG